MSQNFERKEPTFGQPSENLNKAIEQSNENSGGKQPASVSVRSNQSPGHTFTPVMRPTVQAADAIEKVKSEVSDSVKPTAATDNKAANAPKIGFTFTPVEKETAAPQKPTSEPEKMEQSKTENASMERVIPTTATAEPSKTKAEKIPSKYRRLLLVALLLLALLLVFFLLKPKTPATAEDLQEQGSSLPIEFRPVDEEEAKRAEEEARRLQAEQEAQTQHQQTEQNAETVNTAETAPTVEPVQPAEAVAAPVVEEKPVQAEPIAPVVTKPATTGSVIYQAEKPAQAVKTAQQSAKPVAQAQTAKTLKPATANTTVKTESKPQAQTQAKTAVKPAPAQTSAASPAVASKTITVQKGVSLFQNFRDNGLEGNLPELNKMTKLNGATSRLNPGQKITVRLDKNNRIVEMNIGSGRYLRQADGSYIYR